MYWTLELASKLEDAPWPATKEELIDYAIQMSQNFGIDINQLFSSSQQMANVVADLGRSKALIEALPQVRGSSRVTSANPEGTYKTLEKYGTDLTEAARSAGALGAKLTGGGLGGCGLAPGAGSGTVLRTERAPPRLCAGESFGAGGGASAQSASARLGAGACCGRHRV